MRRALSLLGFLATASWMAFAAHQVLAYPSFARETKAACVVCHSNPAGGAELTDAGKTYKAEKKATGKADVKGADYVGINKCKMCHLKEYKSWSETKHAMAMAGLQKADPKVAAEMATKVKVEIKGSPDKTDGCVMCHVTGFHLAGGFPAADSAKTAAVTNVTCEACHGPGSKHVAAATAEKKKMINTKPSANMCMQCHTSETSPKFNFDEYKKRGVHAIKASS